MRTRAQEWSRLAHDSVRRQKASKTRAKYRTACMKMPGLVHQSGLLQSLVFMMARDEDGQRYVHDLSVTTFRRSDATAEDLVERAQQATVRDYLALTREVADAAQWLRRFAQIEIDDEEDA